MYTSFDLTVFLFSQYEAIPQQLEWVENMLEYNTVGGKLIRGMGVVDVLRAFAEKEGRELGHEEVSKPATHHDRCRNNGRLQHNDQVPQKKRPLHQITTIYSAHFWPLEYRRRFFHFAVAGIARVFCATNVALLSRTYCGSKHVGGFNASFGGGVKTPRGSIRFGGGDFFP